MPLRMTLRWCLILWVLISILVGYSIRAEAQLKGYSSTELHYQLYFQVIDPDETLSDNGWTRLDPTENSFGFTDEIYAFKLQLTNLGQQRLSVLLEVAYPLLDHLDFYHGNLNPSSQRYSLGDMQPFSDRVVKNRNFIIPIELAPQKTEIYFFRIQTTSATQFPLNIWNPSDFYEKEKTLYSWYGLYFGIMVVMAMYNLFIYTSVRYSAYLWYVVYVLSMALFQAAIEGLTFRYIWPQSLWWNSICISFFVCTMMAGVFLFQMYFLDLKNQSPNFYLLSKVAIAVSVILIISTFIVPYQYIIKVAAVLTTSSCIIAFIAGYWVWFKGYRQARYFCLAWTVLVIAGFGTVMNYVGLLPRSVFTEYSTQIGSLIEVVLLSFALAEYINHEKRMRFEAQQSALALQKIHNEELEVKVAQRTEELEALNRKLTDLSTTDQLTGLRNRRFLDNLLREELGRCQRYNHPMTLMMLDIDHFKKFNDTYGHLAGDTCLQAVAKRISEDLRWPGDSVARFGGEEFCVLLSETGSAGANKVAERIRSNIEQLEFRWQNNRIPVTISIGIVAKNPRADDSIEYLISCADQALYKSKAAGRNRATFFQTAWDEPDSGTHSRN